MIPLKDKSVGYLYSLEMKEGNSNSGSWEGPGQPRFAFDRANDKAQETRDDSAGRLVNYASTHKKEALIFVNNESGERTAAIRGTASQVGINRDVFNGLASKGSDWTAMHCHPGKYKDSSPSSFSPEDLKMLKEKYITRIEVVGANGDRFIIDRRKTDSSLFVQTIPRELGLVSKESEKDYAKMSRGFNNKDKEDLWAKQSHEANKIVAKKFGYDYKKIKG